MFIFLCLHMDEYKETHDSWNKVAVLYEQAFMNLGIYQESYDAFCQLLSINGAAILDIGCGPGNITRYLLSVRPDYQILGIDVAPNMVALARKNNPTAVFEERDVRGIGTINQQFHGIVIGFCIPYLSPLDCRKLLVDCSELLTEEGILYLSFVDGSPADSGYQVGSSGDRMYFNFHKMNDVLMMLQQSGFDVILRFPVLYTKRDGTTEVHDVLIARKIKAQ